MLKIFLVRPGSTEFDEQGRIKGCLDIPLSSAGRQQVERVAEELREYDIDRIYTAPCQSAQQTAEIIAKNGKVRVKVLDGIQNLDHGLWHGKLIEELKATQPKIFRRFADHPEATCPPQGETLQLARERVLKSLQKLIRKHRNGKIVLVVPDPMATIVRSILASRDVGNLWQTECEHCFWETIDVNEKTLESVS